MPFLTKLYVHPVFGSDTRILMNEFVYETQRGEIIRVPAIFKTNYASIPSLCKFIIDNDAPEIREAAVIHDWLYTDHRIDTRFITRKEADGILIEIMDELGANWRQQQMVYWATRMFGGAYWGMNNA